MKIFLLSISILSVSSSFAQETKEVKTKSEIYSVLSNDSDIKHGDYKKFKKKTVLEEGRYDNNQRVGIWNFYDSEGQIEQSYNYTSNELIENKKPIQFGNYKIAGTDLEPEIPPVFIGGNARYLRYLEENLKYPKESKSNGIEGRQLVIVTLSTEGDIDSLKIYRPISPDIDQEALRLISQLPNEWIPAKHNGEHVKVSFNLPILFRL